MRVEITLDCCDLDQVATFWAAALGSAMTPTVAGRYIALEGPGQLVLTLQRVAEPKAVKNRMHLDLLVPDVDSELARLESLGAIRLSRSPHDEFGQRWYVLADPEGNEFCLAAEPA
jgi:predicted enzyme related to lactoylglutathione lyase